MKSLTRFTILVCVLFPVCSIAQLQVHGIVKDISGAGVPFASVVMLKPQATGVKGKKKEA